MIKYLVIGDPIGHSRSPGMQNAAFEACGLGRPYGARLVTPDALPEFFRRAAKELAGVNLTIPHKLAAAGLADELTRRAAECGSVNTLVICDGRITGDSTDGIGLEEALKYEFGFEVSGKNIFFCGAGGAAQATAVHLAAAGAAEIFFVNRTLSRAEALCRRIRELFPQVRTAAVTPAESDAIRRALGRSAALIQATSLGLKEDDPAPIDLKFLESAENLVVFDTIYRRTPLQTAAAQLGIPVANGKEMLIRQGAESFRLWTGLAAPLDAMRRGFDDNGGVR